MTYDNGEGLVFHFDADYTHPDPSVGWRGGWEIRVHQVDLINEETGDPETITDRSEFSGMVSKLTGLDYGNMEAIAKGERKC